MRPPGPNPLIELSITIIIPSIILMKLSGPTELGSSNARLLALAFPLSRGAWSLLRERRVNLFAVLGLVSILLTGGIGLLQLDPQWLAVKEAAIPALIGIAVLVSTRTRYPLVRSLLYNAGRDECREDPTHTRILSVVDDPWYDRAHAGRSACFARPEEQVQ